MSDAGTEPSLPRSLDPALTDLLRRFGYDIEPSRPGEGTETSIVARRDLGDRAVLLAIDAGGRFRVEVTQVVTERAAAETIAGVPARLVETITRALTISGTIVAWGRLPELIVELDVFIASARRTEREPRPSPNRDFPN